MPQFVGLSLLSLWSLGFLTPFTIVGFMEVLLLIVFLKFVIRKISSWEFLTIGSSKKLQEPRLGDIDQSIEFIHHKNFGK
jgi:hypothetical protein